MPNKRILIALAALLCLCFACSALADTNAKEEQYQIGLTYLGYLTPEDVELSIPYFQNAGNFAQAKVFEAYATALLDILRCEGPDSDLSVARLYIEQIQETPGFPEALEEAGLPSCEALLVYISALGAESEGRWEEAISLFEQAGVLDSLNHRLDLNVKIKDGGYQAAQDLLEAGRYEEAMTQFSAMSWRDSKKKAEEARGKWMDQRYDAAMALFDAGDYLAAAAAFKDLDWKNSAAMYDKSIANHQHEWIEATCETPRTCKWCGETEGQPLGHSWRPATCTAPQTCTRCNKTNGSALGHSWSTATCTEPKTCTRCGATDGSALGHSWRAATYTAPKTCSRCGLTDGKPLENPVPAGLRYEIERSVVTITKYTGSADSVVIPSSIDGYPVMRIGNSAFFNCSSLTSVTIPIGVISIGDQTFYNCSSLMSVTIPGSVKSIGNSAFSGCRSLKSVNLPDSVTSIRGWAFEKCTSLTSVTIPDSVTSIGSWAFSGCPNLTLTVTKGSYAEEYCQANGLRYNTK